MKGWSTYALLVTSYHTLKGRRKLDACSQTVVKEWGSWLHAPPSKVVCQGRTKWLREESDEDCEESEEDWGSMYGTNFGETNSEK